MSVLAGSCGERPSSQRNGGHSCDAPAVREVVARLGERMKRVSLQAPDSIVARDIREAYGDVVSPELLAAWIADPADAPGRLVSSPWPERIEIQEVHTEGGSCRVEGELVYVTSVELAQGGGATRQPVTLRVRNDGGWRVSTYQTSPSRSTDPATAEKSQEAVDVLRRYYAAINVREFRRAYELWGDDGAASGQTFEEFAEGFARTASVNVEIGTPGRVEPAAGSRYIDVPVVIRAMTVRGEEQRFEGTYVLRRVVVDGLSGEGRLWHIYSAEVTRVR